MSSEGDDDPGTGLGRRTAIGALLGVAAGGVAGVAVGRQTAEGSEGGDGLGAARGPDARGRVTRRELVAEDVQGALTDIVGRTSALARLDDLRVAYEIVDDFPPAADRIGAQGWTTVTDGGGTVEATDGPAGIVTLDAGAGRAAIHLGSGNGRGKPVLTLEWRARTDPGAAVVLGAPAGLDGALDEPTGFFFTIAAGDDTWSRGCGNAAGRTVEATEVAVDDAFHRFRITCDGDNTARFWIDDQAVGEVTTDLPTDDDRYGFGAAVLGGSLEVDWAYLRSELPR